MNERPVINDPDEIRKLTQQTIEDGGGVVNFTDGKDASRTLARMRSLAPPNSVTKIRRMFGDHYVVITQGKTDSEK